jgi:hypothetical protein
MEPFARAVRKSSGLNVAHSYRSRIRHDDRIAFTGY